MIRRATRLDEDRIYELICLLEDKTMDREAFHQTYRKTIRDPDQPYYVYEEGEIQAFLSIRIKHYLHHDHATGEIIELIVDEPYRNRGIGAELLVFADEFAAEEGLEELELCTSMWRKDAHRFYEQNGFVNDHFNFRKKYL